MSEPRPAERRPEGGERRRWRPHPFEIAAWASLVVAVLFLRAQGLRIDWNTVVYTVPPLFRPTAQVLLAGPLLYAVYLLLRRRPLGPYLRRLLSPGWLLLWLRLWLTCFVFTYAYFWLKVSVPLINYRLWDPELWALDRMLHLGISPSILLTELFQGTPLVAPIETWYGWWLPTMMFGLSFFCAAPDGGTRRRFMLSSVLIWTLGPWLYLAMPALGPIYAYGETWREIAPELPRAQAAQAMLWENYQTVVAGREGGLKRFNPTRGIAAMPSLHVGGHWLLLLWIRRRARPWLVPAALGTGLTLIGSVVTGWHYAVDGYVGIAVASLAYWLAWRLDPESADGAEASEPRRDAGTAAPGPLRILLVYDCIYPDAHGGIEHRNFEMAVALARRGHQTTLAGWTDRAEDPHPGVRILPLAYRSQLYGHSGRRRLIAAARLAAGITHLDLRPYDLVETANIPYMHLPLIALRCRLAGKPLMISWYEYWGAYWRQYVGGLAWPLHALFERLCAGLGSGVNAISSLTASRLRRHRGRGAEVPVIPSGIPFERIRAAAAAAGEPGPPLVYAGRLQAEKRIDLLLRAVAAMPPRSPEPILSLVGGGPDRDRLERLAEELGISARVRFHGHLETSTDVWRELGRSRIAIQPSSREGFGLFPLEAMAASLPVVHCTAEESAVGELVRHGREGICAPADPESLAAALSGLLDDEQEIARLSRNALARAREYDWDRLAERFERLFYELLDGTRSS